MKRTYQPHRRKRKNKLGFANGCQHGTAEKPFLAVAPKGGKS